MNWYRSHGIDKVLAIVAAILVLIVLIIIAITPPATGFELSIYNSFPLYFWFFYIIANGCGITILVRNAFTERRSHWWLAGLCIVIISNSTLLGLTYLHGYGFMPNEDALTHIGSMKNILETGHLGPQDIYPGAHLLGVSLLAIPNLTPTEAASLQFVSWNVLFLLNIYLLATVITQHRGQSLLITAFASPLIFSAYQITIHPSYLSLYLVPLLLYFLHRRELVKKGKVATTVMIIVLVFVMVLIHQLTTLFVVALLLAYYVSKFLIKRIRKRDELIKKSDIQIPPSVRIALLMFALFILWNIFINHFDVVHNTLNQLTETLYGHGPGTSWGTQAGQLSKSGVSLLETIKLFIYRFGNLVIYGGISVIAVAIIFKAYWSRKAWLEPVHFAYGILFIAALGISLFSLFGVTGESEPGRIVRFIMFLAPILACFLIYRFICAVGTRRFNFAKLTLPRRNIYIISVVLVIIISSTFSVFSLFGSPLTGDFNAEVSRFELTGSEWFITHQNEAMRIATDRVQIGRFRDFLIGTEGQDSYSLDWYPPEVPSHFGYNEQDSISGILDCGDTYLLTCNLGRIYYLYAPASVRDKYPQYTEEDYSRLRSDTAVIQIYANGEFEIWQVHVSGAS